MILSSTFLWKPDNMKTAMSCRRSQRSMGDLLCCLWQPCGQTSGCPTPFPQFSPSSICPYFVHHPFNLIHPSTCEGKSWTEDKSTVGEMRLNHMSKHMLLPLLCTESLHRPSVTKTKDLYQPDKWSCYSEATNGCSVYLLYSISLQMISLHNLKLVYGSPSLCTPQMGEGRGHRRSNLC